MSLRRRSAPYAWERALLWVLIISCTGAELAPRAVEALALYP